MLERIESEIGLLKHEVEISQGEIKEKIRKKKMLEKKLERVKEMYIEGDISKDVYKTKKYQIETDMAGIVITPKQVPELPDGWRDISAALTPENRQIFWKKLIDSIHITSETKEAPRIIFRMGL